MKRWLTLAAVLLFCSAALRADVTVVQTTTIEGGMAAMAAQGGAPTAPKVTTHVKGMKQRTDMESGPINVSTIIDLDSKQVIILRADMKTATIVSTTPPAGAATTTTPPMTGPSVDASIKPTGQSQLIDGVKCDEFAFNTTVDMSSMSGAQMPPEAVAMMKGVKVVMSGSMWVATDVPGAAEYLAFQKAASGSSMAAASGATGMNIPGMDKVAKAMSSVNGLTYLTEMTMTMEGEGQMVAMMKQMGAMKLTIKVSSVSTSPVPDDLFKIPEGYTVTKQ
jgi:hypothetical protein